MNGYCQGVCSGISSNKNCGELLRRAEDISIGIGESKQSIFSQKWGDTGGPHIPKHIPKSVEDYYYTLANMSMWYIGSNVNTGL